MPRHRSRLPQIDGALFLTDGGIETDLMFNDGLELPHFAAFHLLRDEKGTEALRAYFTRYASIARATALDSSLRARHGAPAPTGATSSGILQLRWRPLTPRPSI
jgi:S-methylmethionine-dependent homocysteine/selenocysteine methylase